MAKHLDIDISVQGGGSGVGIASVMDGTCDIGDASRPAKEKEIAAEQVQGKPENIVEKIVMGKMDKWYQQFVLLDQPFVKDDKKSVGQLLEEIGKQVGGRLIVNRFRRMQVG